MTKVAIALTLLLGGCVTATTAQPDWAPTPPADCVERGRDMHRAGLISGPWLYTQDQLNRLCRFMECEGMDRGVPLGITVQDLTDRTPWTAVVWVSTMEPWVLDHEFAHAACPWWDHG